MATCAGCGENISYGQYWLSFFKNILRNLPRSKLYLIISCGHCGQDNVQLPLYILLQFVAIIALVGGVILSMKPAPDANEVRMFFIVFAIYIPLEFVWWTFVTRLKKL